MAASVFAQGTVSFKNGTATPFSFSTDGVTSSVLTKGSTSPVDAVAGSFGPVTVDIFSAPTGTSLAGDGTTAALVNALTGAGTVWSLSTTQLGTTAYLGSGVWTTTSITLNPNAPLNGSVELEVIAFTGSLSDPTLFGFTGETFDGVQKGALGFVQGTGGGTSPPTALATGANGFDGITLVPAVPEPTTMALGGLGAAALLMFRRRK
jgi:hypothetical protein